VVIVIDSSAWIEHFRKTGSASHLAVANLLRDRADIATTEVVVMEVLAGACRPREANDFLRGFPMLPLRGLADYERAAALYRSCRLAGETIRKLTDCLVAIPTIRAGATLLHADRDFEVLARHTPLRLEPLPG
jgi:predicted nucleic acid-binding protein